MVAVPPAAPKAAPEASCGILGFRVLGLGFGAQKWVKVGGLKDPWYILYYIELIS